MLPSNSNQESAIPKLDTPADLEKLKKTCTDRAIIILFWASWDTASEALKSMMEEMPKVYKNVQLAYVDCDESDLVDTLEVENVQTLAVVHPEGSSKKTELSVGIKPTELTELVDAQNKFYIQWYEDEKMRAFRDIESLIGTHPFYMFIKGTKQEPYCKFTKRLMALLKPFNYEFECFNIFTDERIRQWLKVYSKWPTFPQVFINQKFVGGIDVIGELVEEKEFDEMVPQSCKALSPEEKVKKTLADNKLVILINGSIEAPLDDASKDLVAKMRALHSDFVAIDVSERQVFPEVPYIFLNGKPAAAPAGLETLAEDNAFKACIAPSRLTLNERIENLLKSKDVLLFMKGTPENPQCGFSSKTVAILKQYDGLEYSHFNIFEDNEIREGLKKYSDWPTYPQLYVKGALIGGIDIIQELHEDNELSESLGL